MFANKTFGERLFAEKFAKGGFFYKALEAVMNISVALVLELTACKIFFETNPQVSKYSMLLPDHNREPSVRKTI